ncbi:MAG: hypothetical protein JO125_13070, partial [Chloroflexi bacterium]|nr:hypothetical protein [Chloroflexota bacterium]
MIIWTPMVLTAFFDFQAAQFWVDLGALILAIILAILSFWPKKNEKQLSYRVLSDAALIDDTKDLGEHDVQIK